MQGHDSHRMALAQFAVRGGPALDAAELGLGEGLVLESKAWFSGRNVDIYAHGSLEKFAVRARRTEAWGLGGGVLGIPPVFPSKWHRGRAMTAFIMSLGNHRSEQTPKETCS